MSKGYLSIILHAHLPFVRHPEYDSFLEEKWLFEAISETYLPLLRVFKSLEKDGIPFRLTMSISPTLVSMLIDPLLQKRYVNHLNLLIELGEKEMARTANDPELNVLAQMYYDLYSTNLKEFVEVYNSDILKGYKYFQDKGNLEIITTSATHCFLPHYQSFPEDVEAQIAVGMQTHQNVFGRKSSGFWLPECGYYPTVGRIMNKYGINYSITDSHGIIFGDPKPDYGVYAPVYSAYAPEVAFFGRDIASSNSVWSAETGYPGDFSYREFYRDIGYDLPMDYISPYVHEGNIRVNTGYKYYSITGKTEEKVLYNKEEAIKKVEDHADNFLYSRCNQIKKVSKYMGDQPPIITCPYDAELFGHWWFEGPMWLEALMRKRYKSYPDLEFVSPGDYLLKHFEHKTIKPVFSSWGNKGYGEIWLDGKNDWIYKHIHKIIQRMQELVERYPDETGLKLRALNQAGREVLLAQASDWPFIIKTGTTVPYAVKRVTGHINNFNLIYDSLCRNSVKTEQLTRMEKKDNLFPDNKLKPELNGFDYRIFKKKDK